VSRNFVQYVRGQESSRIHPTSLKTPVGAHIDEESEHRAPSTHEITPKTAFYIFHIRTVHCDVINAFIHQLMHK